MPLGDERYNKSKDSPGFSSSPGRTISNITFRNIGCRLSRYDNIRIAGYDASRQVTGVTFEDLAINGRTIPDTADVPSEINEFTSGIRFTATGTAVGSRTVMAPSARVYNSPGTVTLTDLTGRPIRTIKASPWRGVDQWNGIKPGVYFYRAGGTGSQHLGKIVILPNGGAF